MQLITVSEDVVHIDWQQLERVGAPLAQRAGLVHAGLDGKAMIVPLEYICPEDITTMKEDFLRANEKMNISLSSKKYSLKYADISEHVVVYMISSHEILCFINAILVSF